MWRRPVAATVSRTVWRTGCVRWRWRRRSGHGRYRWQLWRRHQVRWKSESVRCGRRCLVLLVQTLVMLLLLLMMEVLLLLLLMVMVLLLLLVCGCSCSGGRHSRWTSSAGRCQLLIKAGRALHRCPLIPQVLATCRRGRVIYSAQWTVRATHCGRSGCRTQEQLRSSCQHSPFFWRQLAETAAWVQQRRSEHVVLAQHRLHRFPATINRRPEVL